MKQRPVTPKLQVDLDFTFGFMILLVAFACWCFNIYYGFTTKQPIFLMFAITSLLYFLFAPVYISRVIDPGQWTLSKWGNSIWSAVMWKEYIRKQERHYP